MYYCKNLLAALVAVVSVFISSGLSAQEKLVGEVATTPASYQWSFEDVAVKPYQAIAKIHELKCEDFDTPKVATQDIYSLIIEANKVKESDKTKENYGKYIYTYNINEKLRNAGVIRIKRNYENVQDLVYFRLKLMVPLQDKNDPIMSLMTIYTDSPELKSIISFDDKGQSINSDDVAINMLSRDYAYTAKLKGKIVKKGQDEQIVVSFTYSDLNFDIAVKDMELTKEKPEPESQQ